MKKILVVDDEIDILAVVKIILNNHNFEVETLSKWENIPHAIQSYSPDLILLDVSLGGADGREICKKLKDDKATQKIPIILFSAHFDLVNNLKGCKADAVITKPFDTSYLISIIEGNLN